MESDCGKLVLDNGIRIVTKRVPSARSVSMGVWVDVGARDETDEESGICHLIEHMIFKGTKRRTALEIAKEFDAIGGQCNAFTSKENTCYHAKVMDRYLETMVDLLSDIFLNSVFDPMELERERQVILQEIRMLEDTPEEHVHVLLAKAAWGNHALGRSILGVPETVAGFDSQTLKDFLRRAYQPDRIVVSAAGNLEHEDFVALTAKTFEGVKRCDGFSKRLPPVLHRSIEVHPKSLEQVHICLGTKGVKTTDPRRYAGALLNVILGGNMSSRLFQEIRERRGLAYAVYSYLSTYSDIGTWGTYVGVDRSKIDETLEVIVREMARGKERTVDPSELTNAKQYLKGGMCLAAESTENQMIRIAQNEINFGRFVPLEEIEEKIDRVTAEEVEALAADIFRKESTALTLLGPVNEGASYDGVLNF